MKKLTGDSAIDACKEILKLTDEFEREDYFIQAKRLHDIIESHQVDDTEEKEKRTCVFCCGKGCVACDETGTRPAFTIVGPDDNTEKLKEFARWVIKQGLSLTGYDTRNKAIELGLVTLCNQGNTDEATCFRFTDILEEK